jgi:hypothetical protein
MPKALGLFVMFAALAVAARAQTPALVPAAPAARFVGVWVGTQGWATANPPPGARQDQPITLTVQLVNGKLSGTLKPFLGGEEGATFTEATIAGDELQATAVVGAPRPSGVSVRRGPPNWKDTVAVALSFKNDGVTLKGRADVTMGEVPWTKFVYELSKKRSRY